MRAFGGDEAVSLTNGEIATAEERRLAMTSNLKCDITLRYSVRHRNPVSGFVPSRITYHVSLLTPHASRLTFPTAPTPSRQYTTR